MMCNGENLRITPRLPKRKTNALNSLRLSLMSFQLCIFSERERASVVVGSLMFFGLMLCEWFVGVWVYIYVLYICHTFNIRVATCDVEGSPI